MPCAPQILASLVDLSHADAFVHGVQNPLRSGFGAHPHFRAPARRRASTVSRVIRSQRDCILNGMCASSASTASANSQRPSRRKRENIVGEPDVVRLKTSFNCAFPPRPLRRASVIRIPVDRLRAPVAAIRAAAAGNHVQREIAVRLYPRLPVSIHIDQIPGRQAAACPNPCADSRGALKRTRCPSR